MEPTGQSLNDGDAFVVDTKNTVFVWYGKLTNTIEKGVAAKFATDYKNEIRPLAAVVYLGKLFFLFLLFFFSFFFLTVGLLFFITRGGNIFSKARILEGTRWRVQDCRGEGWGK